MHSQEIYTNPFIPSKWQSFESISMNSRVFAMSDFSKQMERKADIATNRGFMKLW